MLFAYPRGPGNKCRRKIGHYSRCGGCDRLREDSISNLVLTFGSFDGYTFIFKNLPATRRPGRAHRSWSRIPLATSGRRTPPRRSDSESNIADDSVVARGSALPDQARGLLSSNSAERRDLLNAQGCEHVLQKYIRHQRGDFTHAPEHERADSLPHSLGFGCV